MDYQFTGVVNGDDGAEASRHAGWAEPTFWVVSSSSCGFCLVVLVVPAEHRGGPALPRLALITGASEAMTAPADRAGPLFEIALGIPGVERWPFDLGRVVLAYGEFLRRERDTDRADRHLAAARDTFRRLGSTHWMVSAGLRNALAAAGAAREYPPLN